MLEVVDTIPILTILVHRGTLLPAGTWIDASRLRIVEVPSKELVGKAIE